MTRVKVNTVYPTTKSDRLESGYYDISTDREKSVVISELSLKRDWCVLFLQSVFSSI